MAPRRPQTVGVGGVGAIPTTREENNDTKHSPSLPPSQLQVLLPLSWIRRTISSRWNQKTNRRRRTTTTMTTKSTRRNKNKKKLHCNTTTRACVILSVIIIVIAMEMWLITHVSSKKETLPSNYNDEQHPKLNTVPGGNVLLTAAGSNMNMRRREDYIDNQSLMMNQQVVFKEDDSTSSTVVVIKSKTASPPIAPPPASRVESSSSLSSATTTNTNTTNKNNLAIIIPFRESKEINDGKSQGLRREENLKLWLEYMINYLPQDIIDHSAVFVIEQTQFGVFNKGALCNAGFDYVFNSNHTNRNGVVFDYMILHDVDQIPKDDQSSDIYRYYTVPVKPATVGGGSGGAGPAAFAAAGGNSSSTTTYYKPAKLIRTTTRKVNATAKELPRSLFTGNVGGALLITPEVYIAVNGYSNNFGGWGGEDDNMAKRLQKKRRSKYRYTTTTNGADIDNKSHQRDLVSYSFDYDILDGNFRELYHDRVYGLDTNEQMKKNRAQLNDFTSGLSNLKYNIINITSEYKMKRNKGRRDSDPSGRRQQQEQEQQRWNVTRILVEFLMTDTDDANTDELSKTEGTARILQSEEINSRKSIIHSAKPDNNTTTPIIQFSSE